MIGQCKVHIQCQHSVPMQEGVCLLCKGVEGCWLGVYETKSLEGSDRLAELNIFYSYAYYVSNLKVPI